MLSRLFISHSSKFCLALGITLFINISNSQADTVTGNPQPQGSQLLNSILSQNDPEGVDPDTDTDTEDPNMEDTDTDTEDPTMEDTDTDTEDPNMEDTDTDTETDNNGDIIIDDDRPTTEPDDEIDGEDTPPPATTDDDKQSRFGCENVRGEYTVMYYPASQQGQSYPWAIPSKLGNGWTPEKRCSEIARRLELYRPDGLLELSNSTENGYNIVCVTTEKDSDCRIVLTVPPGQDPQTTRDRVFQNIITADSGESTAGVSTYTGRGGNSTINKIGKEIGIDLSNIGVAKVQKNNSIDLKPFLDRRDGGTGEKLDRPIENRSRQLEPDNFR
jgi:hypothetical protein